MESWFWKWDWKVNFQKLKSIRVRQSNDNCHEWPSSKISPSYVSAYGIKLSDKISKRRPHTQSLFYILKSGGGGETERQHPQPKTLLPRPSSKRPLCEMVEKKEIKIGKTFDYLNGRHFAIDSWKHTKNKIKCARVVCLFNELNQKWSQ